jgi:hypothetical protein
MCCSNISGGNMHEDINFLCYDFCSGLNCLNLLEIVENLFFYDLNQFISWRKSLIFVVKKFQHASGDARHLFITG